MKNPKKVKICLKNPVKDKGKNPIICEAILCKSWFSRAKGLMFSWNKAKKNKKNQNKTKNLLFDFGKQTKTGFHMLFVFYPIDIVLLDQGKKVVEIKKNFRPFTFFNPKTKFWYALECEKSFLRENDLKVGDEFEFVV